MSPATIDTAIVLAAGAGSRMGALTARRPKMFLEVEGRKLIDYQFGYLEARGIANVILATGHLHELVVETLGREHLGVGVEYAENESYLSSGSAWSLFGCREVWSASPRDVLLLHSDLFYDPAILDLVLSSDRPTAFAADDGYRTITRDEVVVTGRGGVIEGIYKGPHPAGADFVGEVVGVQRFSRSYLAELFDYLEAVMTPTVRAHHYEFLSVEAGEKRGHPMYYLSTRGFPWVNVNYRDDLDYARETVSPAIGRHWGPP